MKVGDLVRDYITATLGVILAEPWLSADCLDGGDAWPEEEYYLTEVLFTNGTALTIEVDDLELISASR